MRHGVAPAASYVHVRPAFAGDLRDPRRRGSGTDLRHRGQRSRRGRGERRVIMRHRIKRRWIFGALAAIALAGAGLGLWNATRPRPPGVRALLDEKIPAAAALLRRDGAPFVRSAPERSATAHAGGTLGVTAPADAQARLQLRHEKRGELALRLDGASAAPLTIEDGVAVYRDA